MKTGLFIGSVVGFVVCMFVGLFLLTARNGIVVNFMRQSLVEQNNRLEIEDGKHVIVITREPKAVPELSIDCKAIRLTDASGEEEIRFLRPNQEAIIKFTVKNEGGSANNIEVYWNILQSAKELKLIRPQDPIAKLGRSGRDLYEIKVIAGNMEGQNIVLEFYPGEKGLVPMNKYPVCRFEFVVRPSLKF